MPSKTIMNFEIMKLASIKKSFGTCEMLYRYYHFRTRKISRIKRGTYRYVKLRWLIFYEETLTYINFLHYQNFDDAAQSYTNFLQKFMAVIDKVASIKEIIPRNSLTGRF